MHKLPLTIALLAITLFNPGYATSALDHCIQEAAGIVPKTIDCITAQSTQEDQRLNEIYRILMKDLSSERQAQLRQVQRDWIKFRDSNAAYYYDPEGGQDAHVSSVMKYFEMTRDRANELEQIQQDKPD